MSTSDGGWAVRIGQELEALEAQESTKADDTSNHPTMFLVPSYIKTLKPEAYEHQVLSFGLYGRNFVEQTRMDRVRVEVVREVFERMKARENSSVQTWDDLCALVAGKAKLQKFRHLYDDGPSVSEIDNATVRSVLIFDAVFLVALLLHHKSVGGWTSDFLGTETIFGRKSVSHEITAAFFDLWLFENQVPLSLVREVWKWICEGNDDFNRYIGEIIYAFLDTYLCPRPVPMPDHPFLECNHLLHCLYIAVCRKTLPVTTAVQSSAPGTTASGSAAATNDSNQQPPGWMEKILLCRRTPPVTTAVQTSAPDTTASGSAAATNNSNQQHPGWMERKLLCRRKAVSNETRSQGSLLPMTELHAAGIKARGVPTSVTNISFVKSTCICFRPTLHLPQIDVNDYTDKILRNLLSFEVIHGGEQELISYLSIMDALINTEEDVRLLRKGKYPVIGVNDLGDDKAIADLFNALCKNVCFVKSKKCDMFIKDVNEWCGKHRKRQKFIQFMERYFDRPWIIVSLVAALALLFLAGLQTAYTVKGYFK